MSDKVFRYKFYDCKVVKNFFQANDSICLNLIGANTEFNQSNDIFPGEPICRASICMEDVHLEENQTIIRDYSECSGLTDVLVENGIVEKVKQISLGTFPHGASVSGFVVNVLI